MPYIGKQPTVGNFQVCDAISVVNGQAAYTMQVNSTNVTPETAFHMLVSLNGVLQKPGSSFTISGSTITFASNLATGDVIDFIILLGDVLNIGTPSDNGVTTSSIAANAVTAAKLNNDLISGLTALTSAPASTDEFLISDAGTLKRIDASLVGGKDFEKLHSTSGSNVSSIDVNGYFTSDYDRYVVYLEGLYSANDAIDVYMRFNTGSYTTQSSNYVSALDGMQVNSSNTSSNQQIGDWDGSKIKVGRTTNNSNYRSNSIVTIFNPLQTSYYHSATALCQGWNSTLTFWAFNTAGVWRDSTAVTGLNFSSQSGNIYANNISLYGIKD